MGLGGASDARNLCPERIVGDPLQFDHRSSGGRNANDAESRSCSAVCAGEVTFTPAPQAILANWYAAESVLSIAP